MYLKKKKYIDMGNNSDYGNKNLIQRTDISQ